MEGCVKILTQYASPCDTFGRKRAYPLLTPSPNKLVPGMHGFCKSVLKTTLVSASALLVSARHPKTCFIVIGILCLHSTSQQWAKIFTNWDRVHPPEKEEAMRHSSSLLAMDPLDLHRCI